MSICFNKKINVNGKFWDHYFTVLWAVYEK